tara:strand:+ start:719 stop:1441 length:723 start_codon:yes stop_codon:yes gene_type:complete
MILITRPKAQITNLESKLQAKGYSTFQESFYTLRYFKRNVSCDPNVNYIFSSIHSVKSLKKNRQINKFKNANIIVIGQKVKKVLEECGCKNFIAIVPDSLALFKIICSLDYSKRKYIYFCSNITNEDFFTKAYKNKINIKKKIVYKTIGIKKLTNELIKLFQLNKISAVIFYSQLSAKIYARLLSKYKILSNAKQIQIYCLSDRVAQPLRVKRLGKIHVAKKPNELSLIASIKKNHFGNK